MEYRRAYCDEQPDPWLVERHEREIFPLLHRRYLFAERRRLPALRLLHRRGRRSTRTCSPTRTAAATSARWCSTTTATRAPAAGSALSCGYAVKDGDGRELRRRALGEGLRPPRRPGALRPLRDASTGLEYLRSQQELVRAGLLRRAGAPTAATCSSTGARCATTARGPGRGCAPSWAGAACRASTRRCRARAAAGARGVARAARPGRRAAALAEAAPAAETPARGRALQRAARRRRAPRRRAARGRAPAARRPAGPGPATAPPGPATRAPPPACCGGGSRPRCACRRSRRASAHAVARRGARRAAHRRAAPAAQAPGIWGTLLAWCALEALGRACDPAEPDRAAVRLFESLRLREPMADAIAALGLEGEERWRAAARVRAAFAHAVWAPGAAPLAGAAGGGLRLARRPGRRLAHRQARARGRPLLPQGVLRADGLVDGAARPARRSPPRRGPTSRPRARSSARSPSGCAPRRPRAGGSRRSSSRPAPERERS